MDVLNWLLNITNQIIFTEILKNSAIIVGIYVSLSGLTAWKKKLGGEQTYYLAKKILIGVNKYKHAIYATRNPWIWPHEYPSFKEDELNTIERNDLESIKKSHVYQQRWSKVEKQRLDLYESTLEAKALWPKLEIEELFNDLYKHGHKLWVQVHLYTNRRPGCIREYDAQVVFSNYDEDDIYAKRLDELVLKIEKILTRKLKKM